MSYWKAALIAGIVALSGLAAHAEDNVGLESIFALTARSIEGTPVPLEQFRGKVVLVVNTASKCGFTPQYEALEEIYRRYNPQGFEVLAFPSNDFMGQEPGSNEEIKTFCKTMYDVSFPLFARGPVTGEEKQPVFVFLTEQGAESLRGEVRWNFEKFLLNRRGVVVERYRSFTSPSAPKVTARIEELLKEAP